MSFLTLLQGAETATWATVGDSSALYPLIQVKVAFGTAPGTSPSAWTDVTSAVSGVDIRRGRSRELDTFQAGTMAVGFQNRDRAFDPLYTSGPYFGKLLPLVPIQCNALFQGTTYPLFTGFVTGWPQTYEVSNRQAVSAVNCVDGTELLASTQLPDLNEFMVRLNFPDHYWHLDDAGVRSQAADSGLLSSGSSAPYVGQNATATIIPYSQRSAAGFQSSAIALTLAAASTTGTGCTYECWFALPGAVGTLANQQIVKYSTDVATIYAWVLGTTDGGASIGRLRVWHAALADFNSITTSVRIDDGLVHHLVIAADGVANGVKVYVDGSLVGSAGSSHVSTNYGTTMTLGSGTGAFFGGYTSPGPEVFTGTIQEVVLYPTGLTAANVSDHYQAGKNGLPETTGARVNRVLTFSVYPTAQADVDTGNTTMSAHQMPSGSTSIDYLNTLMWTEGGGSYCLATGGWRWRGRQRLLLDTRYTVSHSTFSDNLVDGVRYAELTTEYDRTEISNTVSYTRSGGFTQTAVDVASRASFGVRALSRSGLFSLNDNEALAGAQWVLAQRKDAKLRFTAMKLKPARDPVNVWPAVLALELEYRVTAKRTPQGIGNTIQKDVYAEGIAHTITSDDWTVDVALADAATVGPWLVLNDAVNGQLGTGKLAY